VEGGGSLYLFHLRTPAARAFVADTVAAGDWQGAAPNPLAVEHRYAGDLAMGMVAAGLVVR
jgi:hypothetical protein